MQTQVIHKLDESVINQIAAGEVVERPASVLKELLDNAIDAQAHKINIQLEDGGMQLISVQDDGIGIAYEQLHKVFLRHATSKIQSFQDLINHMGLGFRGEAMAAISSVSQVTIQSKPKEQEQAYSLDSQGELQKIAFNHGTIVKVEQLFHKVPARKQFLKSSNTEYRNCLKVFEDYAFTYPEIYFKLSHNKKVIYDLASGQFNERLQQLFGFNTIKSCIPAHNLAQDFTIEAMLGLPEIAKDRQNYQYLSINRRPLNPALVATSIKKAYGNRIFPAQRPAFFMNIQMPAHHIDMNVHPRKLDARFLMPSQVFARIFQTVEHSLSNTDLSTNIQAKESILQTPSPSALPSQPAAEPDRRLPQSFTQQFGQAHTPKFQDINWSSRQSETPPLMPQKPLLALAQLKKSYILAENEQGLMIVDQHAAHEKIMYQKLRANFESKPAKLQPLLVPARLELTHKEAELLASHQEIFSKLGLHIESFGGNTVIIQAVADHFAKVDPAKLLQGLLNDLQDPIQPESLRSIQDIALNYTACRSAIKFGQALDISEMQALLDQLHAIASQQYSCPHGRPTQLKISMPELEKLFLRSK